MFRITFAMLRPLLAVTIFIILRVSSNCLIRRLTSGMVVPDPAAIRLRRLPLMITGSFRSAGVIEWMMASMPLKALSSNDNSNPRIALQAKRDELFQEIEVTRGGRAVSAETMVNDPAYKKLAQMDATLATYTNAAQSIANMAQLKPADLEAMNEAFIIAVGTWDKGQKRLGQFGQNLCKRSTQTYPSNTRRVLLEGHPPAWILLLIAVNTKIWRMIPPLWKMRLHGKLITSNNQALHEGWDKKLYPTPS